jgi:hypothetical protein
MKKLILIVILVGSSLVANAVHYRTRVETRLSSTATYPECIEVYEITEEENPYIPNTWSLISVKLLETTCDDVP